MALALAGVVDEAAAGREGARVLALELVLAVEEVPVRLEEQ